MPLKRDKEEVVESRASHILESAIRLMTYSRENFDQDWKRNSIQHSRTWTHPSSAKASHVSKRTETSKKTYLKLKTANTKRTNQC
jgi:hypothetical protein